MVFPRFFLPRKFRTMHKTAILIDGGWMAPAVSHKLKVNFATAEQIYNNAISILGDDEELYRVFYYDSAPYVGKQRNPLSNEEIDFSQNPGVAGRERFLKELNSKPQVALRIGSLAFRGWKLTEQVHNDLLNSKIKAVEINSSHIKPNFMQKGVDMKIGIDIASLVFKKIVSRIILFSADTDMTPAMKLARIEGVQIGMVQIGNTPLNSKLIEDTDFVRKLDVK